MQYWLDYPKIQCGTCEEQYRNGDLASLPCALCPLAVIGPLDEIGATAWEVYQRLAAHPLGEHPPPIELVFALMGLTRDRGLAVYDRLCTMAHLIREYFGQNEGPEGETSGRRRRRE